jgi:uncharacterized protein
MHIMNRASSLRAIVLAVAAVVLLGACSAKMHTIRLSSEDGSKTIDVNVEVADAPSERIKGLTDRESLAEGKGMLFAFKEPQILSFWMRNTQIPLAILFFDERGRFVNSYDMEPCTQDPCPTFESREIAQYALEVNKGFREQHGVGVGWTLDLAQVNKIAQPE